jgi:uncharacterized protein YutE (UPF0331/DUF86 family)
VSAEEDQLLKRALAAMDGCTRRLEHSRAKLQTRFPLEPQQLAHLTPQDEEAIDALLKRFEQLVATIQDQAFKGIALAEAEDLRAMSRRDVTELMEKLGVLPSAQAFRDLVVVRNRLAHTYPDDPDRQAAILNAAYTGTLDLLATARHISRFVEGRRYAP